MALHTIPERQTDPTLMAEGEALILLKGPTGQSGDVPTIDGSGNITWQTPTTGLQAGDQLDLLKGPGGQDGAVPTINGIGDISWDGTVARQADIGTRFPEFAVSASGPISAPGIYLVDTTSGVITLDMPDAATSGGDVYRFVLSVGGNDLVVTTVGGVDLIGTATTKTLTMIGAGFGCMDDGVAKYEIFQEIPGGSAVSVTGTPTSGQVATWSTSTVLKGEPTFTWDGSTLLVAQPPISDPAALLNLTTTWNDGADTFTAIALNVTNTASSSDSLMMNLQVDGTPVFSIARDGDLLDASGNEAVDLQGRQLKDSSEVIIIDWENRDLRGAWALTQGTLTAADNALFITGSWNNGAILFSALNLQFTDTASDPNSLLLNFKVGGMTQFSIGKDGDIESHNSSDESVYERARRCVQTTDATVTTIAQFTLPDDSSYMVNVNIVGKRTDGANTGRLMYRLRAGVYRESAGAATLQGGVQTPTTKSGGGVGAWDAIIDVTGNDFRVRVNGDTGHTVEWTTIVEMAKAL